MPCADFEALAACVAQALNAARIPCVLWGHCLLQVHGVPTITGSIDFAIPDDLLSAGADVLTALCLDPDTPLTPCPDPSCCSKTAPGRPTPAPSHHVHIEDSTVGVGLYLQRETLWFLPPLGSDSLCERLLAPADGKPLPPPFVLASDRTVLPPSRPGRSAGAFKPGRHPIVAVRAHVLLEAYMRIYARDVGTRAGSFGMSMVAYMSMYVDDDGFLEVDKLPAHLKALYDDYLEDQKPLRVWTGALKQAIARNP